ncbi:aspartate kinase [uncultured Microscilla sp.]|uniref:aspartate kinase n=1 Tax=uncultured Microscilla sp. TaxID=432653 RepID=UPI002634AAD0|nr:aspartate kinase [uncultured Microscilla sp.]
MKVFKFGGASVKDARSVKNMLHILKQQAADQRLVIVISAMGKTTNALEQLFSLHWEQQDYQATLENIRQYHWDIAQNLFTDRKDSIFSLLENLFEELKQQLSSVSHHTVSYDEAYDQVISYGEIISTQLISKYLQQEGLACQWLDARQVLYTDAEWRDAQIDWEITESRVRQKVLPMLAQGQVVTQGFIAGTVGNKTTTLGREGSDFTGAIFAASLQATSLTIWKDVDGILNADPKIVANAQKYAYLSYWEAAEMTQYGAKVIHPKTIIPLMKKDIPLHVRSFIHPKQTGTCISHTEVEKMIPAIIFKENQTLIKLKVKGANFMTNQRLIEVLQGLQAFHIEGHFIHKSALGCEICVSGRPHRTQKFIAAFNQQYHICTQTDLQLVTIKNYDLATIKSSTQDWTVLLEERNGQVYQAVVEAQINVNK